MNAACCGEGRAVDLQKAFEMFLETRKRPEQEAAEEPELRQLILQRIKRDVTRSMFGKPLEL